MYHLYIHTIFYYYNYYTAMENQLNSFQILVANDSHLNFAQIICDEMASSAQARGTGIAKRTPEYIQGKMKEAKAVIAFNQDGIWAGYCYIETWSHGEYVANSGLIVAPAFRKGGLAKAIKKKIFELSRTTYPDAKIFGLTTGLAVMKINSELGYEPVTYSELTQDDNPLPFSTDVYEHHGQASVLGVAGEVGSASVGGSGSTSGSASVGRS